MKFLESFAYFTMSYCLVVYLSRDFGFSDRQAGWAYGLLNALTALYGLPAGLLIIDNLGVRWSLLAGSTMLFCARMLMAFTTSNAVLSLVLYLLIPFGQAFGIPVMTIGIRRYTTMNNRSLAFSWFYVVMNFAALCAAPGVDMVRFVVGEGCVPFSLFNLPCFSSYRVLIFVGAMATACNIVIAFFFVREIDVSRGGQTREYEVKASNPWVIFKEVAGSGRFWRFVCLIFILVGVRLIYRHMDATFPKYMLREFGSNAPYGSILGINPFLIIFLVPLVGHTCAKVPAFRMIMIGSLISGFSPLFLLLGPNYWDAVIWIIFLSIGEAIWSPRLYEYSTMIAPKGREGTYITLSSAPLFAAPIIAGALSGDLLSRYCPAPGHCDSFKLWLVIALMSAASPLLLVVLKPFIYRPEDMEALGQDHRRRSSSESAPLVTNAQTSKDS